MRATTAFGVSVLLLPTLVRAEGICEVFVDDETLRAVSQTQRAIAVDRRYEHCSEVDTGESVSESRVFLKFVEVRGFDGKTIARFASSAGDVEELGKAFGNADTAEIHEAKALGSYLKAGLFVRPKGGAKSPAGCSATISAKALPGEADLGIYTVQSEVKDAKGAPVLTKELGAASERPGKKSFKGKVFWLSEAHAFAAEAHMPQRRVMGDPKSATVPAGRVAVLAGEWLERCFAAKSP